MNELADLARRLESMIRTGTIAEVQLKPPRVRVSSGKLTTNWLPWITLRAGGTRDWDPPTGNEQCLIFSPSGDPAAGLVLVGLNSDEFPSPSSNADECLRLYPDGARILYNHASGALEVSGVKTASIVASQKCIVDCPENEITGNLLVKGKLTLKGGADIVGAVKQVDGPLSSNGIVLNTHTHPGTGAPQ
jgi:phage baseplate assembly protein V